MKGGRNGCSNGGNGGNGKCWGKRWEISVSLGVIFLDFVISAVAFVPLLISNSLHNCIG